MQAMDIRTIMRLNTLIAKANTGTPAELAEKLGRTQRTVHSYVRFMREELGAPIAYCNNERTYHYTCKDGHLHFMWHKPNNKNTRNRTQKPKQE
jgi:hypothetical protein